MLRRCLVNLRCGRVQSRQYLLALLLLLQNVVLELLGGVLAIEIMKITRVEVRVGQRRMRLCVHGCEHHLLLLLVMKVGRMLMLGSRGHRLRRILPDSHALLSWLATSRATSHVDVDLERLVSFTSIVRHIELGLHVLVNRDFCGWFAAPITTVSDLLSQVLLICPLHL